MTGVGANVSGQRQFMQDMAAIFLVSVALRIILFLAILPSFEKTISQQKVFTSKQTGKCRYPGKGLRVEWVEPQQAVR